MRYGLSIDDSVIFGYAGQFEYAQKYHFIVQNYLDTHPELHKELLYPNGGCKYYEVLRRALTPEEWDEFMKPQCWDFVSRHASAPGSAAPRVNR